MKPLAEEYKKRIEAELGEGSDSEASSVSYSQNYQQFKREQLGVLHNFFERLCDSAGKLIKFKASESDKSNMQPYLQMAHISATCDGVYSLAIIVTLAVIFAGFLCGLIIGNLMLILAGLLVGMITFFAIPYLPKQIFLSWRAKASGEIIQAVLYMIIYMQHTPNLEKATWFAARHLPPPLSLDFIKVLWDVETKEYSSVDAALEVYVEQWREWDNEFVESIHLIKSSLYQPSKSEQAKTLEKAETVILEGTQEHMMQYAHGLKNPVETLHMLGIVLPIMGLVMLPMVTSFMGADIKPIYLILLYNIGLPILVYVLVLSVLSTRPAGANATSMYIALQKTYARPHLELLGMKLQVPPAIITAIVFFAIGGYSLAYFFMLFTLPVQDYRNVIHTNTPLIHSIIFVAALGLSLATYFYYKVAHLIKIRKSVARIEEEFSSVIFQLGNRIAEGIPVEVAISKIISDVPGAETTKMFKVIDGNMRQQGMSLEEAIFDEKQGALVYYPSSMIRSIMQTLVESAKKSPEIAASTLITTSRYLQNAHAVNERLQDLLADTISGVSMQIKMFAPAISGIVVGLGVLTTRILISLGQRLSSFDAAEAGQSASFGAGLLNVFQIEYALPGFVLQLIIGIYLVEIVAIMSLMLSGIVNGPDKVDASSTLGKNLFMGIGFYVIIVTVCIFLFLGMVSSVTAMV